MNMKDWTGVVLAGGRSTRMGQDKALLEVDGKPLLLHAIEALRPHVAELIVIGDPKKYGAFPADCVPDDLEGLGPLGGIVTAMNHARYERLLVLACDVPNVSAPVLQLLKKSLGTDVDAAVPRHDGAMEPLVAAYSRRCVATFLARLTKGNLRMTEALSDIRVHSVDIVPGEGGWPIDLFHNLNSPSDL